VEECVDRGFKLRVERLCGYEFLGAIRFAVDAIGMTIRDAIADAICGAIAVAIGMAISVASGVTTSIAIGMALSRHGNRNRNTAHFDKVLVV
jgi:hypothetical protein